MVVFHEFALCCRRSETVMCRFACHFCCLVNELVVCSAGLCQLVCLGTGHEKNENMNCRKIAVAFPGLIKVPSIFLATDWAVLWINVGGQCLGEEYREDP